MKFSRTRGMKFGFNEGVRSECADQPGYCSGAEVASLMTCSVASDDTINIHLGQSPLAASAHEVDTTQVRVLIGCVFIEIVIESETCHICRAVLLTI